MAGTRVASSDPLSSCFTNADGNLFVETYNQLNAYFATVPGNYARNLRQLNLLNTNYADLSFLFYDPAQREDERASRHGVPGSRRNRQQHALLSQPAHSRRCTHPDSRDDREWQSIPAEISLPISAV